MGTRRFALAAFAVFGVLFSSSPAPAGIVFFDFLTTAGPAFNIAGSLVIGPGSPTNILGITGSVISPDLTTTPISGLVPNPTPGLPSLSPDGQFMFNNVGYGGDPHLDSNGILFTAGPYEYNIFSWIAPGSLSGNTPGIYQLVTNSPQGTLDNFANPGTLLTREVSAVPEISTWMMMLVGFAGIGLTAYRRAQRLSLADR